MAFTLNIKHDPDRVDVRSMVYRTMERDYWRLITDLLGGTQSMRTAGERRLPREPAESVSAYRVRLNRSFLYEALRNTIEELVAKPFSRTVSIRGDVLPDALLMMTENVDYSGTDITSFLADVFQDGIERGLSHILVDAPALGTRRLSRAQEEALAVHPTLVHVRAEDLIGYRTGTAPTGETILAQVRIRETRSESAGKYGDTEAEYVRVINAPTTAYVEPDPIFTGEPGTWELWRRRSDSDVWERIGEPQPHSFRRVPLVTYYVNRVAFQRAVPPLMPLAWLNLRHWHTSSDQFNILRYARIPMIYMSGMTPEERDEPETVSVARFYRSVNPDSHMQWVEHSGQAIQSGADDIRTLEERMEVLGMAPLIERSQNSTAFGKASNDLKKHTGIQAWIRRLEAAVGQAYQYAAEMIGATLPDDFAVDVFNDFAISLSGDQERDFLLRVRQARELSRDTFLREIKRRGVLADTIDIEDEIARIEDEGPDLMTLGLGGTDSAIGSNT